MPSYVRFSKTVLLVDDLDILRKMVRHFLESLGMEVLGKVSNAAGSNPHSTVPSKNNRICCLRMSEMPGMSGWHLAPKIAGLKPRHLRILYMSAGISSANME